MSKRYIKVIRKNAILLKVVEFDEGFSFYFEDFRPDGWQIRTWAK